MLANEIDYEQKRVLHPSYQLVKQLPISGSGTITVSGGGNELIFETSPNQAFNLAKSYLNFTVTYGAGGVGVFNWAFADCLPAIRSITVQTRGGLTLMSCPEFDVYSKSVLKLRNRINDYLENDSNADNNTGAFCGLQRSDALITAVKGTRVPVTADGVAVGAVLDGIVNYTDFRYLIVGADNSGPIIHYRVPFSLFKDHILGLDKDILLGEALQIKVVFNATTKMGFTSTNVAQPWTGTAAVLMASYSVSNPALYLACDRSDDVSNSLRRKILEQGGLSIPFNYTYPVKTNFSAAGNQSTTIRLNRTNGSLCRAVHYVFTPSTETVMNTFNTANGNGAKINNFYVSLNNRRIQDYNINCSSTVLEDYMAMLDLLRGSPIQTSTHYQYNFVWSQVFEEQECPLDYDNADDNKIMGLPLDVEQKIDFFGTGAVGLNHYSFSVCVKELQITPNGLMVI